MKSKQHLRVGAAVLFIASVFVAAMVPSPAAAQSLSSKEAEAIIAAQARKVILAFKSRNMTRVSQFVHPGKGLRFSPYNYIRTEKNGDRVFTRRQLKGLFADRK